jgi:hypothetical protein
MTYLGYKIKVGNGYNRPNDELDFFTKDTGITVSNFMNYMANNYRNFNEEIGYIPQGSVGVLYTNDTMFIAKFIEQSGDIDPENNWHEGEWFLIAKCPKVVS